MSLSFYEKVYVLVPHVPPGRVTTYGAVAAALGSPRAARQVGYALAGMGERDVPWQRVINAQGRISFRGDTVRGVLQRSLLEQEGVVFDARERVDLAEYGVRWRVDEVAEWLDEATTKKGTP